MSRLQAYLSMESTEVDAPVVEEELDVEVPEVQEVSEQEVYEADDALVEAEEEQAAFEAHVQQLGEVRAECLQHIAALEHHGEILEFGIEHAQYSPQMAAVVDAKLSEYNELIGADARLPSLEAHGADQLGDYYVASLEGIKEIAAKFSKIAESATSALSGLKELFATNTKAADAINAKADALLNQRAFADESTVAISKGLANTLNFATVVPDDMAKAMITDQKSTDFLITKYLDAHVKYAKDVSGHLIEALNTSQTDGPVKAIVAIKTPAESVPSDIASGKALFGRKLHVAKPKDEKLNSDAILSVTRAFGDSAFMPVKAAATEIKVTRAQAESIARSAKVYAELLRKLSREAEKAVDAEAAELKRSAGKATHGMTRVRGHGYHYVVSGDKKEYNRSLNTMVTLVHTASDVTQYVFSNLAGMTKTKAKAALTIAGRCTTKAKSDAE